MKNTDRPATPTPYDDEIDLWQLISTLWKGKYWIIGITVIFVLLGIVYCINTEEEWIANAKVVAPDFVDYQQIATFTHTLQPAFGNTYQERVKAIKYNDSTEVFKRFITLYNSNDNKKLFLKNHPVFSKYLKEAKKEEGESRILNNWAENISATSKDKAAPEEFGLTFLSWTAANSHTLLVDYIHFTNENIAKELQANLKGLLDLRESELIQTLETLEKHTQARAKREIERLNHSLVIAKAANINAPIADPGTTPGITDDFAINLGAKVIEAKINELKNLHSMAVLEPAILATQNQLTAIQNIELSTIPTFNAYKFLETPTEPLSRNHPKKVLFILACIILGGILGATYVLIAEALRSHQDKNTLL